MQSASPAAAAASRTEPSQDRAPGAAVAAAAPTAIRRRRTRAQIRRDVTRTILLKELRRLLCQCARDRRQTGSAIHAAYDRLRGILSAARLCGGITAADERRVEDRLGQIFHARITRGRSA